MKISKSFRWMIVAMGFCITWFHSRSASSSFETDILSDVLHGPTLASTSRGTNESGSVSPSRTRMPHDPAVVLQNYPLLPLEHINYDPSQLQPNTKKDTTPTIRYYQSLLSKFRMTRIVNPKPRLGKVRVKEPSPESTTNIPETAFYPRYQCAGESYDDYMEQVAQMVARKLQLGLPSPSTKMSIAMSDAIKTNKNAWGRRKTMVPPSSSPKNILMIGNSHTRQVAVALEWQYQKQVRHFDIKDDYAVVETFTRKTSKQETTTTLTIVYNHPSVYSPRWKENLEEYVLGHNLDQFDAIVLGSFNLYDPMYKDATLWQHAANYSKAHPEQQIPALGGEVGISLPGLIAAYNGPIVALSGFLYDHHSEHDQNVQSIQDIATRTGRTNLRAMNSRAPLEAVAQRGCVNNAGVVMECQKVGSHQCVGDKGGIPDLVAWDVVEAFYDLLQ